ncbi:trifunctional serine/threonine-protein kinase/ATP-binding protein/sensor histidine kinase [Virgibacillus sp. C22-A2]|uniref:histidine kinase n=1 Tax=Virgibacillus tibetensis TaxID=3042313 RepID=A0ABU6KDZ9_9BACI|nr:trifunctional serine/threonine-protein kinase/ATP-binding protein/sensor histidine kinase [Virgibacillus sp. C22-A2]
MLELPGYRIVDKLIDNKAWTLYKAFSMKDQIVVAIKVVNSETINPLANAEIIHDFHVSKSLAFDYVLQPVKLERYGGKICIVTELFYGSSLEEWISISSSNLKEFLKIAIRITNGVALLHGAHIVHKFLQPQNILLNLKTDEVKLTGFNQSTKLSSETQHPNESPYQLKERVAYMSPEQTGRMNRALDYRTDLYALGVIFYEMITGKLPFHADHPAEMIHAHLAKVPVHPSEVNKEIPATISNIIMTLLEKMPESRYQSAFGLKGDLEKCLYQLNHIGIISGIKLREEDRATMYERPSKLYGRESAVNQLLDGFHRVRNGRIELLLVHGPSGIGKTALVNELHKPLVREKGYFISGKFVQLQKEIPYAPIIHAFQGLLRQILSEGSVSVQRWGAIINQELDSYTSVIANFIPELKWLIGPQVEVPELPPQGVHNRFRQAIRQLFGVFAKAKHPLVLFIDDLQWADDATLDLIYHLLNNPESQHLLIIGAYRDNEVHVGHPFEMMLRRMKEGDMRVIQIPVEHLHYNHLSEWIDETFSIRHDDAVFLRELVYRITQGNPFFIVQVFQSFYDEGVIVLQADEGKWTVNVEALKQIQMSDTIIDFLLKRIKRLPKETNEIVQLASCFGNRFDIKLLAAIAGESYEKVAEKLWEGLEKGLVLPLDSSYKWIYPEENMSLLNERPPGYLFLHDKVQQAFYMSLSKKEREENHLKIGLELLDHYDDDQIAEHIFDIVNHLNHSRTHLNKQKTLELVEWNWMAGERAKNRAATESALHFFNVGRELLPENKWAPEHYDTTFKVMLGLGESQYLNQLFEAAEATFNEALSNAQLNQDKLRVYNLKITLYTHIHQVEKATDAGLDGLRLYNWNFKRNPNRLDVAKEYVKTKVVLSRKKNVDLLDLPAVDDKETRLMMRTLINTNAPTYHVNQNLATILMLRALRLTLNYGDMDVTALVFNNYALTMSAGFNDYNASYKFGRLAIEHTDKFQDNSLKARAYFVFGSFINHWKKHIHYNLDYLQLSQQLCIESGNLHLAGANGMFIGLVKFIKGDNLNDVKTEIERQFNFAKRNEYTLSNDFLRELTDWIDVLSIKNAEVNWEFAEITDDPSAVIIHETIRLQMTYLLQNDEQAMKIMKKLDELVDDTLFLISAPDYYFYHSLWLVRLILKGSLPKRQVKAKLAKKLAKLKKWANHSPSNYMHKYLLIKGELARVNGKSEEAIFLYNRSITLAEKNGYLQDAALANTCAAYYYIDKNLHKSARAYLVDAYLKYSKWGAERLVYDLFQKHSDLIKETNRETVASMQFEQESLDINAIFEATGVISDEVILKQLLKKLMQIVVINAGAERAYLLLNKDEELHLAATNHMNEEIKLYEQPEQLKGKMKFPETLINYVVNTKEAVVLGEASQEGQFTDDSYIARQNSKSILCLPIMYQQGLTGILYLENSQATHVFTKERIALLTLLASQAAIAIENAYLYENLEAKVAERTKSLNKANQNLALANSSLAQSDELRRQMLSNISHDLRSPISTIRGYVDAILEGVVDGPEQQWNYMQVIKRRLTLLNSLVQDLFDLAQLESGHVTFAKDIVPVDQLFKHLCNQFELEVKQAGLDYQWIIPTYTSEDYPLVEVDVRRIEQVMNNLVSNAIKHTEKGEIRVKLSLEKLGEAIITVEDQGSGILSADIPYVFERFYTKTSSIKEHGHGLGLAISKQIIELHKGDIWVDSEEGAGAKFSFSIKTF